MFVILQIRRLKEHVLLQLPPKRRQIIKLVLRRSDINSAMVALGLEDVDAAAENDAENAPVHESNEDPGMISHLLNEYAVVEKTYC